MRYTKIIWGQGNRYVVVHEQSHVVDYEEDGAHENV